MAKRRGPPPPPHPEKLKQRYELRFRHTPGLPFEARDCGAVGVPAETPERPVALVHGKVVPNRPPDYRWLYELAERRRLVWLASAFDQLGRLRSR